MTDATSVETSVKVELGLDIMPLSLLSQFSPQQHELELKHKHCSATALCYNKNAKQMGQEMKDTADSSYASGTVTSIIPGYPCYRMHAEYWF